MANLIAIQFLDLLTYNPYSVRGSNNIMLEVTSVWTLEIEFWHHHLNNE